MSRIFQLVWSGLWQGFGVELSFLVIWVGWHIIHRMVVHKIDPDHFFHTIHDYFTK